jgi:hypothetical protein
MGPSFSELEIFIEKLKRHESLDTDYILSELTRAESKKKEI